MASDYVSLRNYGPPAPSLPDVSNFDITTDPRAELLLGNTNPGILAGQNPIGAGVEPSFFDKLYGGEFGSLAGYGHLAKGVGSLVSGYTGYKNYGLAKDQLKFQMELANRNLAMKANELNYRLAARERADRAAQGSNYRGLAQYSGPYKFDGSPIGS